jgi:ABC-type branched-subunit amino acid transport system substrate-binding protein
VPSASSRRPWLALLATGVYALLLFGCAGTTGSNGKITVGAVFPLTGENSLYGENERKGITLALQEINRRWPSVKMDVAYEDTSSVGNSEAEDAGRKILH